MTVIDRSALLPCSAQQLFELVSDVESYPEYMAGCVGAAAAKLFDKVTNNLVDAADRRARQLYG